MSEEMAIISLYNVSLLSNYRDWVLTVLYELQKILVKFRLRWSNSEWTTWKINSYSLKEDNYIQSLRFDIKTHTLAVHFFAHPSVFACRPLRSDLTLPHYYKIGKCTYNVILGRHSPTSCCSENATIHFVSFSILSLTRHDLKTINEDKKCVLIFSTNFV